MAAGAWLNYPYRSEPVRFDGLNPSATHETTVCDQASQTGWGAYADNFRKPGFWWRSRGLLPCVRLLPV